jgi:cytidine deaminase
MNKVILIGNLVADPELRKTASDIYSKGVCAPCGACRQVILEAEYRNGAPIEILLPSQQGIYVINGISTLLPFGFSYDEVTE